METATQRVVAFTALVRQRTSENNTAINSIEQLQVRSVKMGILRQELDSLVRVIFLLNQAPEERDRLIRQTLDGERWRRQKGGYVRDAEMVDLSNTLIGWSQYVYRFGCAYIHLSNLHAEDAVPLTNSISKEEKGAIRNYVKNYHAHNLEEDFTTADIEPLVSVIFQKISTNLECYLKTLENGDNELV